MCDAVSAGRAKRTILISNERERERERGREGGREGGRGGRRKDETTPCAS